VGNFTTTITSGERSDHIDHGVAVIATGAAPLVPDPHHYGYGQSDNIITSLELDRRLSQADPALETLSSAVFIQCVGSREPERPYCSRVCCTHSIDNALALKARNPEMAIYILYRDIRTYGEREYLYQEARDRGIIFIRFDAEEKPQVRVTGDGGTARATVTVTVRDHILKRPVQIEADLITLATAIVPPKDQPLAQFFKIPMDDDGFFVEKHAKLGPSEFASDGVFLCGLAHYPKPMDEAIAQGKAAASRAATLLAREQIHTSGQVAMVQPLTCTACGVCASICPYSAPALGAADTGPFADRAQINAVLCKGCGLCVASCRSGAIDLMGFDDRQIMAQIMAGTEVV
jgi:heterodisulfide reductase subunit A